MLQANEETSFIGLAELRKESPQLLRELQKHKVVLTKRNKPVGVILSYEKYQRFEELMDLLEDLALGYEAKSRERRKGRKIVTLEEAERRVGLR